MENIFSRTQAEEIEDIIKLFCRKYFNKELERYARDLLEAVKKNRRINIFRGQKETWAAAIICVIARLNFLFDSDDVHYITPDLLCRFFNTKKLSIIRKADQIFKECKIFLGDKKYSGKEIYSMFDFYKTRAGFIVAKTALDSRMRNIEELDKEEAGYLRQAVEEKKQQEEKKLRDKIVQRAEKKKELHKGQIDLFG